MNWYEDAKALRKARLECNPPASQATLAKEAGVKRSLIANIEAGRRPFSREAQKALWKALARINENQASLAKAMDQDMGKQRQLKDLLSPTAPSWYLLQRQQGERSSVEARALIHLQEKQISELQDEIQRLKKQNALMRQWLKSEEESALAHEKAAALHERAEASVKGNKD